MGELREALTGRPDNMPVVVRAHDHHYSVADFTVEQGTRESRRSYAEWYDGEPGQPIDLFVIS